MSTIKEMALNPQFAYRTEKITVPEWENTVVQLKEISPATYVEFRALARAQALEEEQLGDKDIDYQEVTMRSAEAEAIVLIDVLHEENGKPVFTREDLAMLANIYGPIHSRLVNRAFRLSAELPDDVKKK